MPEALTLPGNWENSERRLPAAWGSTWVVELARSFFSCQIDGGKKRDRTYTFSKENVLRKGGENLFPFLQQGVLTSSYF